MGILYVGPYADDVNREAFHEGYAARLWTDGTLTSSWGGERGWTGHSGLVGACECGWRSAVVNPCGDYDSAAEQAAERDFETQHLAPLVEAAKARSWPQWAQRVAAYADQLTRLVANGRLGDAGDVLASLREDVEGRDAILADLILDRDSAEHRDRADPASARPFVPIAHDQQPLASSTDGPSVTALAPRGHTR